MTAVPAYHQYHVVLLLLYALPGKQRWSSFALLVRPSGLTAHHSRLRHEDRGLRRQR